jgi:hypothetical protein
MWIVRSVNPWAPRSDRRLPPGGKAPTTSAGDRLVAGLVWVVTQGIWMTAEQDCRAFRGRRLCLLLIGIVLAACDLRPLVGAETTADPRRPVETVTALEIEVEDLLVDEPAPARFGRP